MADEETSEIKVNVKVEPVGGTKSRTIGFSVFECEGAPIYRPPDDYDGFFEQDFTQSEYRVTEPEGLHHGDRIFVPMLHGYAWATVEVGDDGKLSAMSGEVHGHVLKFTDHQPDGPCWVVVGSYNLRGLKRLEITR